MSFWKFFLDIIFPIACLGCGEEKKQWLCSDCKTKIKEEALSPKNNLQGEYLEHCYSLYTYSHPIIRKLLEAYKYRGVFSLQEIFDELLCYGMKKIPLKTVSIVIPLPLHKRRERLRGYNQSVPLAETVAQFFGVPVKTDILIRRHYTTPQVHLSDTERKENMNEDIFSVAIDDLSSFEKIVLVDDVSTTGATLNATAKVLKAHGAKKIIGLTFAG